ncbi:MAG: aspartate carbamoyltransferase [Candidatus Kerfeldbacteria bacterium]|nr:aspartate carbamoyltransferase [Candidatus Kerfeldbacteria bacterium]
MTKLAFKGRDIISIDELNRHEIEYVLENAAALEKTPRPTLLTGHILASLFFEPSTRTQLSFASAMMRLGGSVLGVANSESSSRAKGETVYDTAKMAEQYADIIVIRHPHQGAARVAAEASAKPVINAGDGANQHPTQTLLDLYSIKKTQGKLEKLHVAVVGDLKYGRAVHSLTTALADFSPHLSFVAPKVLAIPKKYLTYLTERGIPYSEHEQIEDVIKDVDVLYMTRIQKERFGDPLEYERVKNVYVLSREHLRGVKRNMKILHPLPRVSEIACDVDETSHAYYFQQAGNGVFVRQALLGLILGKL